MFTNQTPDDHIVFLPDPQSQETLERAEEVTLNEVKHVELQNLKQETEEIRDEKRCKNQHSSDHEDEHSSGPELECVSKFIITDLQELPAAIKIQAEFRNYKKRKKANKVRESALEVLTCVAPASAQSEASALENLSRQSTSAPVLNDITTLPTEPAPAPAITPASTQRHGHPDPFIDQSDRANIKPEPVLVSLKENEEVTPKIVEKIDDDDEDMVSSKSIDRELEEVRRWLKKSGTPEQNKTLVQPNT